MGKCKPFNVHALFSMIYAISNREQSGEMTFEECSQIKADPSVDINVCEVSKTT